jgi:hypothetical protein
MLKKEYLKKKNSDEFKKSFIDLFCYILVSIKL